jgi:hypothetical protein
MALTPVVARLRQGGGTPQVEVVVGHLLKANYQLLLFDDTGANPVGIGSGDGKGTTGDGVLDKFSLPGAVPSLHRKSIFWQASLAALAEADESATPSATVRVLQDDRVVGIDGGTGSIVSGQFHLKVEA